MPNFYHAERWKEFRAEVIELDGGVCQDCRRGRNEGLILQVHHKQYTSDKMPWEYAYSDCETLCKGCHAARHGKIRPLIGWSLFGDEDLGELSGSCECCDAEIRYVFWIQHPFWEPMGVGTICCDNLTGTQLASNRMESLRRFRTRQERFVSSPRWKSSSFGFKIRQKGIQLAITRLPVGFQIMMDGQRGKKIFCSLEDAKKAAFEVIENGKAQAYLQRIKDGVLD